MTSMHRWVALLVLAATTLLAACGPGEEGTGIQPVTVNVGVLRGIDDESVTVNGVTYDRAQAVVVDGFDTTLGGKGAALRLGMWVEVQGTVDDSGESGVAQTIRVRPALRGRSADQRDTSGPSRCDRGDSHARRGIDRLSGAHVGVAGAALL